MSKRRTKKPRAVSARAIRREIGLLEKRQKAEGTYGHPLSLTAIRAVRDVLEGRDE